MNTSVFTKTNARFCILTWEPVVGSGEQINVGVLSEYDEKIFAKPLIRPEVLRCMYGAPGESVMKMIESTLNAIAQVAEQFGLDEAIKSTPLTNFNMSKLRTTFASSQSDLFRQIVLMHCSLSVLAEEPIATADDSPTSEKEVNQQWTTRVKEAVQIARPELSIYFNREATLVDGGVPVRFAMLTPRMAAQFGLLVAARQNQGMEDARAKMWKLALAKERNSQLTAALIFGVPNIDEDITLSDKQREQVTGNTTELEQEATHKQIELHTVHTVSQAATAVLTMA